MKPHRIITKRAKIAIPCKQWVNDTAAYIAEFDRLNCLKPLDYTFQLSTKRNTK